MLNTGIFPDELKIAKVIPLFKKYDPKLLKHYRPISLLPTISKVIEKIIFTQLSTYFNENKLIFDNQYGFRPKHSTEYAALELVDRIITDMDKKEVPINIFLDLSKAFDTIDHTILLAKLRYYGIHDTALLLLKSYLNSRKQDVEFEDTMSDTLTTNLAAVVCVDVCQCAKFDQFLPARSHFESKRSEKICSHSKIPIRCLWTAFCVPLSFIFYEKQ